MIYNYLFSSGLSNKEFLPNHSKDLYQILKQVKRENIVMIVDRNKNFLKKIFLQIKELQTEDPLALDSRAKDLRSLITEVFNSKNSFGKTKIHEIDDDAENLENFCKNIKNNGIDIDAIITADDENIKVDGIKNIKISEFQFHNIEEKRQDIYDNGLIDLSNIQRNKIEQLLKKSIWNSETIYLYDYHLQKIYNNHHLYLEWKTSFEFWISIFTECKTNKGKIKLNIVTPFPKDDPNEDKEKTYKKSMEKIKSLAKDSSGIIDCSVQFMDSRIDNTEFMHDRFLLLKSCIFGLGRGADLLNSDGSFKPGSLVKHEKIPISFFNKIRNFNKIEFN